MNTVTIGVASRGDTQRRLSAAFRGKKQGARVSFASEELLWKTLTPKRWALLRLMAGKGAMAIREIARRAERDVRAVHSDIHILLRAGILEKASEGGVVFPYDAVHVDFLLKAA
jgi:predicted transcriptional regulator